MNTMDILRYGHLTVQQNLDGLPESTWLMPGVAGTWSVKDIIAHLASFEHLLVDVLRSLQREDYTPVLESFKQNPQLFNETEVSRRREMTTSEVWAEYETTHRQTLSLLAEIPVRLRRLNGTLPWYGAEYDLEDYIVYSFYGHKREHGAQIAIYRDQIARTVTSMWDDEWTLKLYGNVRQRGGSSDE